jgi:hypothetical protein
MSWKKAMTPMIGSRSRTLSVREINSWRMRAIIEPHGSASGVLRDFLAMINLLE